MNKKLNKKKNPIKTKKEKLINRINQCKSLNELQGLERTLQYNSVLSNNYDWDYDFLLDLIEFKLKRMSNYFHTHQIVEHEDWYGTLCDRAIAILNAGYKTNIITDKDLHNYVNTRNVNRFFNPKELDFILKEGLQKYYLPTVREKKAKALFWKFLHHYIEYLWD